MGLCVLCGLPGAGKSTLAAALKERASPAYTMVSLSYDEILAGDAFEEEESPCESREVSCQSPEPGGREVSELTNDKGDSSACQPIRACEAVTCSFPH